jgi:hypothetical protein
MPPRYYGGITLMIRECTLCNHTYYDDRIAFGINYPLCPACLNHQYFYFNPDICSFHEGSIVVFNQDAKEFLLFHYVYDNEEYDQYYEYTYHIHQILKDFVAIWYDRTHEIRLFPMTHNYMNCYGCYYSNPDRRLFPWQTTTPCNRCHTRFDHDCYTTYSPAERVQIHQGEKIIPLEKSELIL